MTLIRGQILRQPFLVAIALFVMFVTIAPSSQVRSLNLEEISERAVRILTGRCVESRVERDAATGLDVNVVTLDVERTLKGSPEQRITVRMLRMQSGTAAPSSIPEFVSGEDVVLFLYGESRLGLTSPVGFAQGKFSIHTDKSGRRIAVNGAGNTSLMRGLTDAAAARLGDLGRNLKPDDPVELDTLLEMVDRMRTPEPQAAPASAAQR